MINIAIQIHNVSHQSMPTFRTSCQVAPQMPSDSQARKTSHWDNVAYVHSAGYIIQLWPTQDIKKQSEWHKLLQLICVPLIIHCKIDQKTQCLVNLLLKMSRMSRKTAARHLNAPVFSGNKAQM